MNKFESIRDDFFREKPLYTYEKLTQWNRSLCSKISDQRGPHQKVIAISIFSAKSKSDYNQMYSWEVSILKFLIPLANEINLLLPEWILRVYIDFSGSTKSQQEYFSYFSNVDICDINHLPLFGSSIHSFLPGRMWRFLPIFDPFVDYFLSRDLDSPIIQREVENNRYVVIELSSKKILLYCS